MTGRLAILRFWIIRYWYVLASNLLRRHDHDGGIDCCSCGCPIWGCHPCGYVPADRLWVRIARHRDAALADVTTPEDAQ